MAIANVVDKELHGLREGEIARVHVIASSAAGPLERRDLLGGQ